MKVTIKIEKEIELKTLVVKAKVRYWEDADVNGRLCTQSKTMVPLSTSKISMTSIHT